MPARLRAGGGDTHEARRRLACARWGSGGDGVSGTSREYYFIIPDAQDERVLVFPEGAAWTLPHAAGPGASRWQATAQVNQVANEALQIRATTRRCVSTDMDPGSPVQELVYAIENHALTWTLPSAARWLDAAEAASLPLATPGMKRVLEEWFAWVHAADTTLRVPWYQPGWTNEAGRWIVQQLAVLDSKPTGPVEQVCSWQRSCVMRLPTTHGMVYFKAVPAALGQEVDVTVLLDHEYHGMVPEVLAIDADRRWMLMRDMGAQTLDAVPGLEQWKAAVRTYAQLQVDWVDVTRRFSVAGCPSRGLLQLVEAIDRLLTDTVALRPGQEDGLTMKQIHALHYRARALKIAAHRLGTLRLPTSVDHGDFWAGQIIRGANGPVFIDWSDACLSHPFLSMAFFSDPDELRPYLGDIPDASAQLRDAYLEPWTVYEPYDTLTQAWSIACSLAPLSSALLYHDRVLPVTEVKWELENMIPFFLHSVLRHQGEALPTLGMADYEQQAESFEYEQEGLQSVEPASNVRSQLDVQRLNLPH